MIAYKYICLYISICLLFLLQDTNANLLLYLDQLLHYPRIKAFLDTISYAEGTLHTKGYNILYGDLLFHNFSDHPRRIIARKSKNKILSSSAAGRYQILARTWDDIARQLHLTNFSPRNQDKAAIALIRQMGALCDVIEGKFEKAAIKVSPIWASFPAAKYKQRTLPLKDLKRIYLTQLRSYQKKR